jgi:hypothetical protein
MGLWTRRSSTMQGQLVLKLGRTCSIFRFVLDFFLSCCLRLRFMSPSPYPIMIPLPKKKLAKGGLASPIRLVWTYLKSNTSSLGPNLGT